MRLLMDLDETLICNFCCAGVGIVSPINTNSVVGFPESVFLRPHARKFLGEARNWFSSIYLATMSSYIRAVRVLSVTGLSDLFDGVYGYEDLSQREQANLTPDAFVLVDDQPLIGGVVQPKLLKFGAVDREDQLLSYVQIPAFDGSQDDAALLELLCALTDTGDIRAVRFTSAPDQDALEQEFGAVAV